MEFEKMSAFVAIGRGLATGVAVLAAAASVNDLSVPVMVGLGQWDVGPRGFLGGAIVGGLIFGTVAVALTRRRGNGFRDPIAFTPSFVTRFYGWCAQPPVANIGGAVVGFLAAAGAGLIFTDLQHALPIAAVIALGGLLRSRRAAPSGDLGQ
jgi:hypothetical protein